jgi:chromate reductase
MSDLNLVGLCGSLRAHSTNRKLLHLAARRFGPARFTEGDLRLPLYDGDLEEAEGIPAEVARLADLVRGADAVIIACPEYNKGVSGVMKNALDWLSRVKGGVWRDKPVAIMSAAAGRAGGERSQYMLRLCLTPFRPHLLAGPEVLVAASGEAFDADGMLKAESYVRLLDELTGDLRAAAQRRREVHPAAA